MILELPPAIRCRRRTGSRALSLLGRFLYSTIPPFLIALMPVLALRLFLAWMRPAAGVFPAEKPPSLERMLSPLNNLGL